MPVAAESDIALLLGACAVVAAVALRVAPRIVWPDMQGTDAYYHLAYIRLIRDTGHRLPRRNPRILGPGEHSYPALFHWLLSFAGPLTLRAVDRFGGLVCDLTTAGALGAWLALMHGLAPSWALASVALYLLAPGLTLPHIGPRAFTLTPRCWAQLLYAAAVLCWLAGMTAPFWFAASAVPLALMLLLSKFAVQNLAFVAPLAAVLLWRWEPVAASFGGVALAALLFRGTFVRQLVGQAGHLTWYVRHNLGMIEHRRNWRAIKDAIAGFDPRRLLEEVVWHNPLSSGLLRHFTLILALGLACLASRQGSPIAPDIAMALALTVAALFPWLATAFGHLRILGESERYLEFAAPATWILLWATVPEGALAWLAGGLGAVFLLGYAAALAFMARSNSRMSDGELRDVATYLPADGETVLLCLHDPESYYFLAASDVRLCKYNGDLSAFGPLGAFLPWFFWRYPFVHPEHLDAIVAEHGVRYVLLNKRGRERLVTQSHMDYDLTGFELLHENDGFGLYRTGAAAGGAASR